MITDSVQKINNTKLAKKLSVTSQCVSQWFSGKRQPSIEMLPELAKALNCTIEQVVYALIQTKQTSIKKSATRK